MVPGRSAWSFRPVLQLMAGRSVGFAATFFVPVILVRVFDQETFGTYKQLFLVYATLFPLAQLGMAESLFYFLPLHGERSPGYLANAVTVLALSGAGVLVALVLADDAIAGWLGNPALEGGLALIGVFLLFMLASAGLEIALLCRHRYLAATVSYAVSDALRAAALVVPALLFQDLRWVLVGAVAFAAARLAVTLGLLGRRYGIRLRPDRSLLARQVAYNLPFQLAIMVEIAQTNLHQYAVAYWFDPATFAIYAVGCLQIPLADLAASSAGRVLMVGMGDAHRDGDTAAARRMWTAATRKLALLLVPAVAVFLVVARDLIPFLFTEAYRAAVPVFAVWMLGMLAGVVQTDCALRVYADVRFILGVNLVRLAVIAASIAWAVSALGLVGAVAVTVFAQAVAKAVALVRVRRRLDTPWSGVLPWTDLLAIGGVSAAAAVPPLLMRPWLEPAALTTLLLLGAVYAAALLALLALFRILRDDEIPGPVRRLWPAAAVGGAKFSETR